MHKTSSCSRDSICERSLYLYFPVFWLPTKPHPSWKNTYIIYSPIPSIFLSPKSQALGSKLDHCYYSIVWLFVHCWHMCLVPAFYFSLSDTYLSLFKVRRAGLNVEFAPDQIAYQLNVRDGALILKVNWIGGTHLLRWTNGNTIMLCQCLADTSNPLIPYLVIWLQVPPGSAIAKAGLVPTGRGFAGNIVLGDVIVAVDGKPVSACGLSPIR